jgi:hypothetical protein
LLFDVADEFFRRDHRHVHRIDAGVIVSTVG